MKPYYEQDGITIYHGDCREILPGLHGDAVITDPPYNVGKDYGANVNDAMPTEEYYEWCLRVVEDSKRAAANQFWVAPRYKLGFWLSLLPAAHLVVIRRGAAGPYRQGWSDQFQIALAVGKPNSAAPDLWDDIRLKGEGYFFREETYGHPGYTPSQILGRAVALLTPPGGIVVEPFAGTGTTLRAAKDLGRRAIGIEIEERYCEIAARRLDQGVLDLAGRPTGDPA